MRKNLFLDPDDDLEIFRDLITDNAFSDPKADEMPWSGELLGPGMKKYFGNFCCLEGVSHAAEGDDKVRSKFFLHTQAEDNLKIEILWNYKPSSSEPSIYDYESYSEFFFEDNGKGPFDDGPNYDPREHANWDEIFEDLQGVKHD